LAVTMSIQWRQWYTFSLATCCLSHEIVCLNSPFFPITAFRSESTAGLLTQLRHLFSRPLRKKSPFPYWFGACSSQLQFHLSLRRGRNSDSFPSCPRGRRMILLPPISCRSDDQTNDIVFQSNLSRDHKLASCNALGDVCRSNVARQRQRLSRYWSGTPENLWHGNERPGARITSPCCCDASANPPSTCQKSRRSSPID
jgi:hypothetical protein